jgi:hypothetical protein
MEGGVALFLLFVLIVVFAGVALALYLTGGALILKRDTEKQEPKDQPRPVHERPTSPTQENVEFVGVRKDDDSPRTD